MADSSTKSTIRRLADRLAIEEVLARYCRGIDRCDPDELAAVFTKDARIDYGDGPKPPADTISGLMAGLGAMRLTQHNIGNVICRIEGKRARCESYCVALHILPRGETLVTQTGGSPVTMPDIEMVVGGRYLDTLVRQSGSWRIAERLYIMDWNRQGPATMQDTGGLYDTLTRRGGRGDKDPSHEWWQAGFPGN
jgi:hypothetical protein